MELINVNYISVNNIKPVPSTNYVIPKFETYKTLDPVVMDDLGNVAQDESNLQLLNKYLDSNFLLIPIRRKSTYPYSTSDGHDFPLRVLLELTSVCNLNCVMCPRTAFVRPMLHMPKSIAMRCIDELDEKGIQCLWLYHIGESLLHPDAVEIIEYCKTKKRLGSIWMSSNGQQLSDASLSAMLESNITFLNYSINAMNEESYNKIAPLGKYNRLRKNLDRILAEKNDKKKLGQTPWLRLQMIEQPQVSSEELDDFLTTFGPTGEMFSINKLEAFSQNVVQNNEHAKTRTRESFKRCIRVARNDCFISAEGEVSFCDTDFNYKMSLGNIRNHSIEKIWRGPKHAHIHDLNAQGRLNELEMCRNCLDYDL